MPHVVLTDRNAPPELLDVAELATGMTLLKHPFRARIERSRR